MQDWGEARDILGGLAVIQGDPDRLEEWVSGNLMKFNEDKYKVLCWWTKFPGGYRLSILGSIERRRTRRKDYPVCSVLVRLHVITEFSFGLHNTAKTLMNLMFEGVWQRPKRWWGLDYLPWEESLGKLNLFCLEHKQLGGGLDSSPQCTQGCWRDTAGLFMMVCGRRTEDNRHKMKQERFRLEIWRTGGCPMRQSSLYSLTVIGGFQEQPGLSSVLTLD